MKILVTGGNGFIGRNLCPQLAAAGHEVITATRASQNTGFKNFVVGAMDKHTNWHEALEGIDCVIHLAARVHVMKELSQNPLHDFMLVNCHATKKLAQAAEDLGVKKFIFISSIGVNGENTLIKPFSEASIPAPLTPYAISKLEAEKALQEICQNMSLIIIRPPLLYGPNCKGNFDSLIKLCKLPIPLPFGLCSNNKKNLLYIDNFSDFVIRCIENSEKSGLYLIADDIPLSTANMIKLIRESLGSRSLLMPIPYLDKFLQLIGKKDVATKLLGSLEVDITKAKKDFNWTPPYTPKEGIYRTIKAL